MLLINVDQSLEIMDTIINNETISHTEAKKLMARQVKPSHRDLLLETLDYNVKTFSFSSYANDDDIHGMTKTKKVHAKMYKKSDILLAIEEYKADSTLSIKFNEIAKQNKIDKENRAKKLEQERLECIFKLQIEQRAKEIMESHNSNVSSNFNINTFDPYELLTSFDQLLNDTMTYEEAYQQAKNELL